MVGDQIKCTLAGNIFPLGMWRCSHSQVLLQALLVTLSHPQSRWCRQGTAPSAGCFLPLTTQDFVAAALLSAPTSQLSEMNPGLYGAFFFQVAVVMHGAIRWKSRQMCFLFMQQLLTEPFGKWDKRKAFGDTDTHIYPLHGQEDLGDLLPVCL